MFNGKQLYTPSAEAFIYIILDNNWKKWIAGTKYCKKHNWPKKIPAQKTKEELAALPQGQRVDIYHDAKYTRKDGGQQKMGTFSNTGINTYMALAKEIHEQRNKTLAMMVSCEKGFLPKFRELHGIADKDEEKKRKNAGDGKKAPAKKPKQGRKSTFNMTFDE